jgi:hypothetical protein
MTHTVTFRGMAMGYETEAMRATLAACKEQMDRIEPQWPALFGGPGAGAMSDSAPNNVWHKGTGADASAAAFLEWQDHLRRQEAAMLPDTREMDLRNMRALLDQKDARIAELTRMVAENVDVIMRMSSENGALSDEVDRLKRDLENLRPKPATEAPHNPWGKRHSGQAPDVGEPR